MYWGLFAVCIGTGALNGAAWPSEANAYRRWLPAVILEWGLLVLAWWMAGWPPASAAWFATAMTYGAMPIGFAFRAGTEWMDLNWPFRRLALALPVLALGVLICRALLGAHR